MRPNYLHTVTDNKVYVYNPINRIEHFTPTTTIPTNQTPSVTKNSCSTCSSCPKKSYDKKRVYPGVL